MVAYNYIHSCVVSRDGRIIVWGELRHKATKTFLKEQARYGGVHLQY
jgi:hypothetical protein